jgi:hypothetical protein
VRIVVWDGTTRAIRYLLTDKPEIAKMKKGHVSPEIAKMKKGHVPPKIAKN